MDRKIYQVSEVTREIKGLLERELGSIWLEGELSNVRRPASGHCYFTIKDATSQIAGVMFRGNQRTLRFTPADGLKVQAFGEISVYERSGQYQIIVRQMIEGGTGALQAAFEALKQKLRAEGLFDAARKRPLPLLVQRVGVVTSATGAAIRDILNVLGRRFPNLQLTLAPVRVQGEGAADEIAAAVGLLNRRGGFDVLIVGRGGGSLEDLWAFNEEPVARAIAESRIPVISAVGHEIDFTISDFVADLRAPTPSAAAELVVGRKSEFEERIRALNERLGQALRRRLLELKNRFTAAAGSYVFRQPENVVAQQRQRLRTLTLQMRHAIESRLSEQKQAVDDLGATLARATEDAAKAARNRLDRAQAQLRVLDPLAVLARGYSVTWDRDGRIVRSAGQLGAGDAVRTRVAKGSFQAEVTATDDDNETNN